MWVSAHEGEGSGERKGKGVREVAKKGTGTGKDKPEKQEAPAQGVVKPTAGTGKAKGFTFMAGGRSPLDDRKAENGK